MSPVIYTPQMKVIHTFGGTFSVTEKVIYAFLYYYVIDNRHYIKYMGKNEVPIRNFSKVTFAGPRCALTAMVDILLLPRCRRRVDV